MIWELFFNFYVIPNQTSNSIRKVNWVIKVLNSSVLVPNATYLRLFQTMIFKEYWQFERFSESVGSQNNQKLDLSFFSGGFPRDVVQEDMKTKPETTSLTFRSKSYLNGISTNDYFICHEWNTMFLCISFRVSRDSSINTTEFATNLKYTWERYVYNFKNVHRSIFLIWQKWS